MLAAANHVFTSCQLHLFRKYSKSGKNVTNLNNFWSIQVGAFKIRCLTLMILEFIQDRTQSIPCVVTSLYRVWCKKNFWKPFLVHNNPILQAHLELI